MARDNIDWKDKLRNIQKEEENEMILPPCDYQILSDKVVESGMEPNNRTGKTRHIEIMVTPLDLLEEFLKMMKNPPEEYIPIKEKQGLAYKEACMMLEEYLEKRKRQQVQTRSYNING